MEYDNILIMRNVRTTKDKSYLCNSFLVCLGYRR